MKQKPGLGRIVQNLLRIIADRPRPPASLKDNPLLNTILDRRSTRRFSAREIPEEVYLAILEAGRLAPSTVNLQTWSFITFTAAEWRETFQAGIPFKAQRAVIVIADTHRVRLALDAFPDSPLVEYTIAVMNASLATMAMNIAAEALGVASVMLSETGRGGFLDAGYLKEKLGLPEHTVPLTTIIFGYPAGPNPPMPPKLPLEVVSFSKHYQDTDQAIMLDWLAQIEDGYQVGYFPSTFEKQLQTYTSKIGLAEASLQAMVLKRRI